MVDSYFKNILPTSKKPVGGYNLAGRGYPDISAEGTNYVVFIGGVPYLVSGTSASAPVVASMLSLVNAARLANGKTSIGWINPTLYYYFQSFTKDITIGKNNCIVGDKVSCCKQGFNAAPGWDPATGLGSLNFLAFKTLISSIGGKKNAASSTTKKPTATASPTTPSTILLKIVSTTALPTARTVANQVASPPFQSIVKSTKVMLPTKAPLRQNEFNFIPRDIPPEVEGFNQRSAGDGGEKEYFQIKGIENNRINRKN